MLQGIDLLSRDTTLWPGGARFGAGERSNSVEEMGIEPSFLSRVWHLSCQQRNQIISDLSPGVHIGIN